MSESMKLVEKKTKTDGIKGRKEAKFYVGSGSCQKNLPGAQYLTAFEKIPGLPGGCKQLELPETLEGNCNFDINHICLRQRPPSKNHWIYVFQLFCRDIKRYLLCEKMDSSF